ncbi:conserved hypothetical protein [Prevotella intermedia]|uniref:Uncharacterized protein n=1 Tax=Prevotella intermedia TaxID=28131 RepID=A0A0S3UMD7_PREIN|nr:conserved hypothetical protein [Prevotella intermedia]
MYQHFTKPTLSQCQIEIIVFLRNNLYKMEAAFF